MNGSATWNAMVHLSCFSLFRWILISCFRVALVSHFWSTQEVHCSTWGGGVAGFPHNFSSSIPLSLPLAHSLPLCYCWPHVMSLPRFYANIHLKYLITCVIWLHIQLLYKLIFPDFKCWYRAPYNPTLGTMLVSLWIRSSHIRCVRLACQLTSQQYCSLITNQHQPQPSEHSDCPQRVNKVWLMRASLQQSMSVSPSGTLFHKNTAITPQCTNNPTSKAINWIVQKHGSAQMWQLWLHKSWCMHESSSMKAE